jgi:hypothetical protein
MTCATFGGTRPVAELRAHVRSAGTVQARRGSAPDGSWPDLWAVEVLPLHLSDRAVDG